MLSYGRRTDVGRVRKMNQDSMAVVESDALDGRVDGLFIVADGMGGRAGGEIASRVTVDTLPAVVREVLAEHNGHTTDAVLVDAMREGVLAANEAVWRQARANPELRGMGTTCVAALIRGSIAAVANVGDSRLYLLRDGALAQLTRDHSLVQERVRAGELTLEEARGSRFRNVITRAIGIADDVEPDVETVELQEGDTLLLCSDGLTNMVPEADIAQTLASTVDAQEACERLVTAANRNGGADNITAVVVRNGAFTPVNSVKSLSDGEEAWEDSGPMTGGQRRRIGTATRLSMVLLFLLGSVLGYLACARYGVVGRWPLVRLPAPTVVSPPPAGPAPLDLGALAYRPPALMLRKPVRGAPLACDTSGSVYVMTESGRILRVALNSKTNGDFSVPTPTKPASASAEYWTADVQGNLYVSSKADRCIYKYDRNGTRKAVIGVGELQAPQSIAVDGVGNLYVVDKGWLKVIRAYPPGQGKELNVGAKHSQRNIRANGNPDPVRMLRPSTLSGDRHIGELTVEDPHGTR